MTLFPFSKFLISGESMHPYYKNGERLLIFNWFYLFNPLKVSDVVIVWQSDRKILKRIAKINGQKVYLLGDNPSQSTDSRKFGWIDKKFIQGKVICKL